VSRFWSDHVAALAPYVPGEQPKVDDLLKLNTNENPYGPSPKAIAAMQACLGDGLRLYPDPESTVLRAALARGWVVTPEQVFAGNGSDEVLAHVFHGFFLRGGRPVLMPDITYSFYRTYARLYDVPCQLVPLTADFRIAVDDYLSGAGEAPAAIIFANPNAPTGIALPLDEIRRLAAGRPDTLIVVDEAYAEFGAESAAALLAEFDNLLVVHTFSKSRSLAGLRVGYALGRAEVIEGLTRVKDSFNSYPLDRVAQAGATAAFEDRAYFEQTRQAIMQARTALTQDLIALGFEVLPSLANFVFARHPAHAGAALAAALRERRVLVRRFAQPRIEDFLRITIGTPQECQRLTAALRECL
jgi:histidinol-phosphate aminotransferase